MTDATRTPTQIDTIADAWVDTLAEQLPTLATYIGRSEFNDRYGDYSPAGQERLVAAGRHTLADLEAATPVDAVDAVTQEDLAREIRLAIELHDAQVASARPQRDRFTGAGHPLRLRPHADRHSR